MSNVLDNVTLNYLSDVDVPFLEQRLINHWQERANKISDRRQNRLNKKLYQEQV